MSPLFIYAILSFIPNVIVSFEVYDGNLISFSLDELTIDMIFLNVAQCLKKHEQVNIKVFLMTQALILSDLLLICTTYIYNYFKRLKCAMTKYLKNNVNKQILKFFHGQSLGLPSDNILICTTYIYTHPKFLLLLMIAVFITCAMPDL